MITFSCGPIRVKPIPVRSTIVLFDASLPTSSPRFGADVDRDPITVAELQDPYDGIRYNHTADNEPTGAEWDRLALEAQWQDAYERGYAGYDGPELTAVDMVLHEGADPDWCGCVRCVWRRTAHYAE